MSTDRPHHLSAGEQTSARIVADRSPILHWVSATDATETSPQVTIEAVVDDGPVRALRTAKARPGLEWPWDALPSRAAVEWRIREDDGDWSRWSRFTTPLWSQEDWHASWISPPEDDAARVASDRGAWILRRDIDLVEVPISARLYATALGVYSVTVNGVAPDDTVLAPGSSSYDETLYAQAYDVGHLLRIGRNRVEFTVSDGWLRGRNGGPQLQNVWGNTLAVLAQLELTRSGGLDVFATDDRWVALPSPIVRADLMTGQTTDFTVAPDAPGQPVIVDAVHAPLPSWSPSPPVRRIEERRPRSITVLHPGRSIVDTGQNTSGWLRLTNLGSPGSSTTLEYAEHLDPSGDITTSHLDLHMPDGLHVPFHQRDTVIAGTDDTAAFEPAHTVHGFRYVRVDHPGRTLDLDDLTVVVVHTDLPRAGSFTCDVDGLVRLHDAADWSFRSNIVDVPTDCPTRERSAWTGDFGVFAPVAARLYDIDGFAQKWLRAVRDDQAADGVPAMFSPDPMQLKQHPAEPMRITGGSAGWGDALVDVPWVLYREYADLKAVRDHWPSMKAWVDYALNCAATLRHPGRAAAHPDAAPHERWIWDAPFHFGEWMQPKRRAADGTLIDPMVADPVGYMTADRGELGTAYLYRSVGRLAEMARAVGRVEDAAEYARAALNIADAWRTEYLRSDGTTAEDTQAGYARALTCGLIPDDLRQRSGDRLAQLVRENDTRLDTGFLSSGILLPALADHGHLDLAYELLLRDGEPSWLGMLARGATTMWEEWEGVDEHGIASASLNHYSKGAVIGFLYSHIAGITQDPGSIGWERVRIEPRIGGGLRSAQARCATPQGDIEVAWSVGDHAVALDVTIPPRTRASVTVPGRVCEELGPGVHHLAAAC